MCYTRSDAASCGRSPQPMGDGSLAVPAASSKGASMRKAERKRPHVSPELLIPPSVQEIRGDIQDRIAALPEVKSCLRVLRARGLSAERVLKYVATLVLLDAREGWRKDKRIRKIPDKWRRLAKRLRTAAEEVDHTYTADSTRPDVLALSLGVAWVEPTPPQHDPRKAVESMRDVAADLEEKARLSGRIRKTVIPWIRRQPEVALLRHACKPKPWSASELSRERLRDLFQRLAELIDTVYEAYEIKPRFSADSLEKTFKRHVLPGLSGS